MNYKILVDNESVHILLDGEDWDFVNAFIDIYTDDGEIKSPFKNSDDAKTFAEIIVKLLEQIT